MMPKIALNGFDMTIGLIDIETATGYNIPNLTKPAKRNDSTPSTDYGSS